MGLIMVDSCAQGKSSQFVAMELHMALKQMKYGLYAGTVSCNCSMYWHTDCCICYSPGWRRKRASKVAPEVTVSSQDSVGPSVHSVHVCATCSGGELLLEAAVNLRQISFSPQNTKNRSCSS